jgi:hypothetical protein
MLVTNEFLLFEDALQLPRAGAGRTEGSHAPPLQAPRTTSRWCSPPGSAKQRFFCVLHGLAHMTCGRCAKHQQAIVYCSHLQLLELM